MAEAEIPNPQSLFLPRSYNDPMFRLRCVSGVLSVAAMFAVAATAQAQPPVAKPQPPPPITAGTAKPQPPPSATGAAQPTPTPAKPAPSTPAKPAAATSGVPAAPAAAVQPAVQPPENAAGEARPTDAQLGVRVYPGAKFLGSYDAGRGQRFYLFGALQPFAEMVNYYKIELKDKGELVFDVPPTHMFDVGKFREETMAFPPSVTVKDYTWGGSPGYANPTPGTAPAAFPTVIQIVPPPAPAGPIR